MELLFTLDLTDVRCKNVRIWNSEQNNNHPITGSPVFYVNEQTNIVTCDFLYTNW